MYMYIMYTYIYIRIHIHHYISQHDVGNDFILYIRPPRRRIYCLGGSLGPDGAGSFPVSTVGAIPTDTNILVLYSDYRLSCLPAASLARIDLGCPRMRMNSKNIIFSYYSQNITYLSFLV